MLKLPLPPASASASASLVLNHLAPNLYSRNVLDHQLLEKPKREVLHPNSETVVGPPSIVPIAPIALYLDDKAINHIVPTRLYMTY